MLLVKMAARNLWRRKFRTILTVLALGLSYSLTIFFIGLADGSHEQMAESAIKFDAGHVVIQAPGYQEKRQIEMRIQDPEALTTVVHHIAPKVLVVQRIFTSAALQSEDASLRIDSLVAVDPDSEKRVSEIPHKLLSGRFLTPGKPGIIIGSVAAKRLKVQAGDPVVLTVSGLAGRAQERIPVIGVFRTGGGQLDAGYAMIPLSLGQRLLGMGRSVNQVALFADLQRAPSLAGKLRKALDRRKFQVLTWDQALPNMAQFIWLDSASMWVMLLVIFLIVAVGVVNAVLMSVMERTREIGVLKALGMGPGRVVGEVIAETFLLGLLAVAFGLAAGLLINHHFTVHGLDIQTIAGTESFEVEGIAMTGKIYSKLSLAPVIQTSVGLLLLTVTAGLYPALRAARLVPVEAIHRG